MRDLRQEFSTYRKTIASQALQGYEAYARQTPTKKPEEWPCIFDYIAAMLRVASKSAEENDEKAYDDYLGKHRYAMNQLFYKMLDELTWGDPGNEALVAELAKDWAGDWVGYSRRYREERK